MEALILPAFIAGLFTFLAPCTLPLVPGYLAFISGVSGKDLRDQEKLKGVRKKVFINGLLYVIGFSLVFVLLGTVFGAAGSFLAKYRVWLGRIGGVFVIFFGLYLMHVFKLPIFNFLNRDRKLKLGASLTPGKPSSSFLLGVTFALGWTPCVGPVLGSILLLATTAGQVWQGAVLLLVFSLGLAIPFLLIALAIGHATEYVKKITKYLNVISIVGGAFLVFVGYLLLTDNLIVWMGKFYQWFEFINYDSIYNYL